MKKRAPLKLSFDYMDTAERRVLSLEDDGLFCLPVIGFDNYRKKRQQAALHVHEECLEITLCLRGDLEFETRSKTYPFKPGSIFVSGPKDVHRLKSYPKGMSKYWLLFRIPGPDCRLLELPQKEARSLVHDLTHLPNRLFAGTDEIQRLFKKLFQQYDTLPTKTPDRSLRLRSTALSLLLAIVDAASSPPRERPEVRLERIIAEMRAHPERSYPLDDLAEKAALSPNSLLTRFKRLTGSPPHAFLIAQRIARAKEMLAEDKPISFIANQLGFSSPQHFASLFKEITGHTPSTWRMYRKSQK